MTANVCTSGAIAVTAAVFAVTYQRVAPWWTTRVGRHLMALTATVGLFGAYTVLIYFWPHGAVAAVLRCCRVAIGLGMIVLLVRQSWLLVRTQREGVVRDRVRREEEGRPPGASP
ncbi:hypothetical protein ABZX65_26555 [Streptomyces sp. NPDC003300]|uniref:putative phage holin n=1 Tax=unclassified Streptomyces TaxID=2593676 RepID=UPI0033B89278